MNIKNIGILTTILSITAISADTKIPYNNILETTGGQYESIFIYNYSNSPITVSAPSLGGFCYWNKNNDPIWKNRAWICRSASNNTVKINRGEIGTLVASITINTGNKKVNGKWVPKTSTAQALRRQNGKIKLKHKSHTLEVNGTQYKKTSMPIAHKSPHIIFTDMGIYREDAF